MEKGFYHPERGYWQTLCEPSAEIVASYPAGTFEVPLKPSPLHTFDGSQWVPPTDQEDYDAQADVVRLERDLRLATDVDPVVSNPLRWADMSAEKQQEWVNYRQALLDVTQQEGFPFNVVFPTKPA